MVLTPTGGSLGTLTIKIGTDLSDLQRGLANARRKIASTTDSIGRSTTRIGVIVSAAVGAVAFAAIKFEDAFAGVRKTVDATEAEFNQLEKNFLNLSRTIPSSAVELSQIGEIAGQLGVRGVENITKFTETIAQIEATTNLTRDAASTNFARIANVIQEPISNIDRMGSAVVELGNNFATTEVEILDFAERIAGAGQVVGLSSADIFAIGTAFSSVGVQAERGGTAVSKSLIKMAQAVQEGGAELGTFAQIAGVSSEEFRRAFEEDATRAFALFIDGLKDQGPEAQRILQELELGDQRLVQSFLAVGGASGILVNALDRSRNAFAENIALQEEFDKRNETTASQLKILRNNLLFIAITIGDALLPVINDLIQRFIPVIDHTAEWIDNNKELTATIVKATAAFGAFALGLGPVLISIGKIVAAILFLVGTPIGLMISGMALIATAWTKNWLNIREVTVRIAATLGEIIDDIQTKLLKFVLTLQNFSEKSLKDKVLSPIASFKDASATAEKAIDALKQEVDNTDSSGKDFAETIVGLSEKTDEFVGKIKEARSAIGDLFTPLTPDDLTRPTDLVGGDITSEPIDVTAEEQDGVAAAEEAKKSKDELRNDEIRREREKYGLFRQFHTLFKKNQKKTAEEQVQTEIALREQSLDNLQTILQAQAKENKAAAIAYKALSITRSIIATALAVTEALPNIPLSILIGTIGAAQTAIIAAQGFQQGTDRVPSMLTPGEMVIPNTFADAIRKGNLSLSGPEGGQRAGSGGTVIENIDINIQGDVTEDNIDRLVREINDQIGLNAEESLRGAI